MLTEEEVRAIVDSRVALLKGHMQAGSVGELRKWGGSEHTGKEPWPEFWPGYNQCVREKEELAVHLEYGVFPYHLIKSRSPNQTEAEFNYIKANFKQVTLPNSIDFFNTISRADSNWRIEYRDEASDIEDYLTNNIGELGDFTAWANDLLPKIKIADPMGIICTMPLNVQTIEGTTAEGEPTLLIDPNTMTEPQPNYFPVNRVWGFEHGKWYCLLTTERSWVKKGGRTVKEGYVMWVVDDTNCWRVAQTGEAYKLQFDISLYFPHEQGYPPCIFLMGTPTLKDNRVIYQSSYLPSKPAFDTVLLDTTYLMMVKSNSAYPYRVMLGNECEYVANDMGRCVGGNMTYVGELGEMLVKGKCPKCNGTGLAARLGPNGVLFVQEARRSDNSQISVHDAMTFVEPTSTTMDFLRREIVDQTNEGRKVMYLNTDATMTGGEVKTATQSGIDLKASMAFRRNIANQLFLVREFTVDCIAIQRYGKEQADGMVKVVRATSYDLKTEAEYMADWTSSSTLPPPMRQLALEGYISVRYPGDASMREALEVIALADRLWVLNQMEIASMNPRPEPWELKLHQQALALYDTLAKEEAFMALDKFAKAERLKELARASAPSAGAGDIAARLVAGANA